MADDKDQVQANADPDTDKQSEARKNAEKYLEMRRETNPRLGGWDNDAADLGWTAQQGPAPAGVQPVPGYVVTPEELPDPDVQVRAGIDPAQANAGVPVAEDAEDALRMRGVDLDARKDARGRAAKSMNLKPGDADVERLRGSVVKDEAVSSSKFGDGKRAAAKEKVGDDTK